MLKYRILLSIFFIIGPVHARSTCNLNVGVPVQPIKKDPVKAISWWDKRLVTLQYDTLVRFGNHGEILPWLAKKWEISSDLKRLTFELRPGVSFSNGTIVNAKSVKNSLDEYFGINSVDYNRFKDIKSIKAISEFIVEIKLKRPFLPLLFYLATPRASIFLRQGAHLYGSGPWVPSDMIIHDLKSNSWRRNKDYFKGAPICDSLNLVLLPPKNIEKFFIEKKVDLVEYYAAENLSQFQENSIAGNVSIKSFPSYDKAAIFFTEKNEKSNSISERQWLARKISAYFSKLNLDYSRCSILPVNFGNSDRKCDSFKKQEGKAPISLELYLQDDERYQFLIKLSKSDLELKSRFNFKLVNLEEMYAAHGNGKVSAHVETLTMQIPDPYGVLSIFVSNSRENFSKYANPKFDSLLTSAVSESDAGKRTKLYSMAESILLNDGIIIPLLQQRRIALISKSLHGYATSSVGPFYASYDSISKDSD
ncbi:MAG: ABC transporter substrate-binding protein [Bdellovibrionaceae bacterium]|nr:ABC transporter substrate-binding protein [Bdellovibrio sp.]